MLLCFVVLCVVVLCLLFCCSVLLLCFVVSCQEPFVVHKRGHQMKYQPKRIYAVSKAPDELPLFRGNADKKDWSRIQPMPQIYMNIIEEINKKFGVRPNRCLVNYMMNDTDHYLPMHQDQPFSKGAKKVEHKDSVYIVTLGVSRPLVFGGRGDLGKKELNELSGFITSVCSDQGDLYELRGNLNTEVTHGILKDAKVKDLRVSLTFRFVEHSFINVATGGLVGPGAKAVELPQQQQLQPKAASEKSEQVVFWICGW